MHRALREAKDSMHVSISYLGKLKGTMQNETTKLVVGWSVLAVDYIKNGVVALSMADSWISVEEYQMKHVFLRKCSIEMVILDVLVGQERITYILPVQNS